MSWIRALAGLSGASAVGAGAWGAHGFRPKDPHFSVVYQRANHYHLLHSLLIASSPLAKQPSLVAGLAAAGIGLFSGRCVTFTLLGYHWQSARNFSHTCSYVCSCYLVALKEDRSWSKAAPAGGFALIAAWLALML
jgi:uncharacterized membrane protein YgdD (TMEM256/DUF423 family)